MCVRRELPPLSLATAVILWRPALSANVTANFAVVALVRVMVALWPFTLTDVGIPLAPMASVPFTAVEVPGRCAPFAGLVIRGVAIMSAWAARASGCTVETWVFWLRANPR